MNIRLSSYLKDAKPQLLFKYWFNCWANKDVQEYQDLDWDWEEEIKKFIKSPVSQTLEAIKMNPEICFCCGKLKDPETLKEVKHDQEH